MTYWKGDDHIDENEKLLACSAEARWLYICGLAYASRKTSRGIVRAARVPRLVADLRHPMRLADELVREHLWHTSDDVEACESCSAFIAEGKVPTPGDGQYLIHEFFGWNRTPEEIRAASERARIGGRARAAQAARAQGQFTSDSTSDPPSAGASPAPSDSTSAESSVLTSDSPAKPVPAPGPGPALGVGVGDPASASASSSALEHVPGTKADVFDVIKANGQDPRIIDLGELGAAFEDPTDEHLMRSIVRKNERFSELSPAFVGRMQRDYPRAFSTTLENLAQSPLTDVHHPAAYLEAALQETAARMSPAEAPAAETSTPQEVRPSS